MEVKYCRRCGEKLRQKDSLSCFICKNGHIIYINAAPTVGLFLVKNDLRTIILSQRGIEPRKGELDSFGGFVEVDEHFEEALEREVQEETSLTRSNYSTPTYLGSSTAQYLFSGEERTVISTLFFSIISDDVQLKAHDDVADIVTIDIDKIDESKITATDTLCGIRLLRKQLEQMRKNV
jgi:8-oxo-dGTP diphosphatase